VLKPFPKCCLKVVIYVDISEVKCHSPVRNFCLPCWVNYLAGLKMQYYLVWGDRKVFITEESSSFSNIYQYYGNAKFNYFYSIVLI